MLKALAPPPAVIRSVVYASTGTAPTGSACRVTVKIGVDEKTVQAR